MRQFIVIFGLFFAQNSVAESVAEMAFRLKASVTKVHVLTKKGGHGVGKYFRELANDSGQT
jgi:hypothetical protein